jgi:hypothetical protein
MYKNIDLFTYKHVIRLQWTAGHIVITFNNRISKQILEGRRLTGKLKNRSEDKVSRYAAELLSTKKCRQWQDIGVI